MVVLTLSCLLILAVAVATLGMVAVGMGGFGADRLPRFAARSRLIADQLEGTAPTPERFIGFASDPRASLHTHGARAIGGLRALSSTVAAASGRAAQRVHDARAERATSGRSQRPVRALRTHIAQH